MSTQATHDLVIKAGEYLDNQGQTKSRWLKIGCVFRHDDGGMSIKLDAIPVGVPDWQGWVSVFARDQSAADQRGAQFNQPAGNQAPPYSQGYASFDNEMPFN